MLAAAGCVTPTRSHQSLDIDKEAWLSFLQRGDYPERLGFVMQHVFADHRFSVPWIVVRGSDSSTWFVAERFESKHRFDRVYVHFMSEERVMVSITAYQFGPSDWTMLGRLFGDFSSEERLIAAEIAKKLSDDRHAVR
jgi:hypothetical protein